MSERCVRTVFSGGSFRGHKCSAIAKVEREGKWYCNKHDPVKREARQAESDAKWNKEREAHREQFRRASHYQALMDALIGMLENAPGCDRIARSVIESCSDKA